MGVRGLGFGEDVVVGIWVLDGIWGMGMDVSFLVFEGKWLERDRMVRICVFKRRGLEWNGV